MSSSASTSTVRLLGIVFLCIGLSLFFFAPCLWIFQQPMPGSYQWDRALTFLLQCEQPFRRDIETAMHWRLLPPLVAHTLHLPGRSPLALPWLGAIAAIAYIAVLIRRRCDDPRAILGGTLTFASTSAVLVPFGLLGLNDAWVWLGLFSVAFGRARWALPLACLLCPWVDERFIIGFPLAWIVARIDRREPIYSRELLSVLWLLPYIALRLGLPRSEAGANGTTSGFLAYVLASFGTIVPLIPLGWWFGLRAAWAGVAYALWTCPRGFRLVATLVLCGTLLATAVLAHDISRSIAIILPVALLGGFEFLRRQPSLAPRVFVTVGLVSLLLPAAHVIYRTIQPISPLPLELVRLLRSTTPSP